MGKSERGMPPISISPFAICLSKVTPLESAIKNSIEETPLVRELES
ncbi:MAG: hypothetical protein IIZ04_03310 [Aeriscardovia sp.]|nr:hypothetical protein [Aeriscardovia sp.]